MSNALFDEQSDALIRLIQSGHLQHDTTYNQTILQSARHIDRIVCAFADHEASMPYDRAIDDHPSLPDPVENKHGNDSGEHNLGWLSDRSQVGRRLC